MKNHYGITVTTAPTWEPVTRAEAKFQCSIEPTESYWDAEFSRLIQTAREYIETRTNRSIVAQTLQLTLPRFPRETFFPLPRGPVRAVSSVTYLDGNGASQTLSPSDYLLANAGGLSPMLALAPGKSWPATWHRHPAAVTVTYTAGPATQSAVPQQARQCCLLLVAHWFANRETLALGTIVNELEHAVEALLRHLDAGDDFTRYGDCFP